MRSGWLVQLWAAATLIICLAGLPSQAMSQAFPAVIDLGLLDGEIGFALNGVDVLDQSGISVSGLGDVNGDDIDDFIIGSFLADPNGQVDAGECYVVFGRTTSFPATFELTSLYPAAGGDGSAGFVVKGVVAGDQSGISASGLGDVNDDGIDDFIIGASDARNDTGEAFVVFGRTTAFPATFELASLYPVTGGDGSAGFILKGVDAGDSTGIRVSGLGDVNADGIDDLIIGAWQADPNGQNDAGESYVVFGRTTGFPATFELRSLLPAAGGDGSAGFVLKGIDSGDGSGLSVRGLGDVNHDGVDDLIIGAFEADPNGRSRAGEAYVVFGRTTGFPAAFELRSLLPIAGGDGTAGFVLKGIDEFDSSGLAVSGLGDVNGDGIDDLIVGAYLADPNTQTNSGESYVVFGRATGFPATFELSSLYPAAGGDGSSGFVLRGVDAGDHSGASVGGSGDINGDGIDDLLIGANRATPRSRFRAGESYVVFGRTTGFAAFIELRSLWPAAGGNGSTGFVLTGVDLDDGSGYRVRTAGDVNGDGIDDLMIAAPFASPNDKYQAGQSYVVFGRPGESP